MAQKSFIKNVPYNAADAMYADTVPYYPSKRYIDKNLAPEQFPKESVRAAARAAREAVDAGVISPSLATLILPNILTEGRPDDFGVRGGNRWEKGENAPIGQIVKKLGLQDSTIVKKDVDSSEILKMVGAHFGAGAPAMLSSIPLYKKGDVVMVPKQGETPDELAYNAKLMTAVLAEKSRIKGGDDLATIKKWNGTGKEADNHLNKVMEVSNLLVNEPRNADIMKLFKDEFLRDASKTPPDPNQGKM